MPLEHETEKLFTAPTPPLAHGPDHAQARALALQVVPPTAYHAQFSVEQRAAYNLAQAYLALAPQPSVPPQERVSEVTEAMVEAVTLGLLGTDLGKTPLKEAVRYALTAALSAGRADV